MKLLVNYGIYKVGIILLASLLICCNDDDETDDTDFISEFNAEKIIELRREKDKMFHTDEDSSITATERSSFKSLSYFPPDEKYFLPAAFEPFDNPDTVLIRTNSVSDNRKMLKYGKFTFIISDSSYNLFAYKSLDAGEHNLFVPFSDATNGSKTYEAGRYLDVEEEPDANEYILDFNLAYNPYCAYSDKYTCPRTPAENRLPIAILAGEKKYQK